MKTIRIFISSPGDVAVERDKARKVVEGLQKRYAGRLRLETVLWEDLPLGAVDSFQGGIDVVLKGENAVDIAVFILWSRLGSPLGAAIRKPDGTPYRSGTEREFELMLAARAQSPDSLPEILVYVRQDDRRFKAVLQETPTDKIEEMMRQHKLAEQFIREQFHDADTGSNLRAYHTFPEPNTFAERLKTHLRSLLDTIVMDGGLGFGSWEGSPYRGLEVFRSEHAPIFFGRDEEVCDILERMRAQAEAGCAFLLLVGASGSGKSSLARAGVLPALETDNPDESVAAWRTAALTPGECADGLCRGLARTLLDRIPELRGDDDSLDDLEQALLDGQGKALSLLLKRAFAGNPGTAGGGPIRLVLLLDQLEELFTHPAITEAEAAAFLAALQALAVTGCVWVLATVRSDFYDRCQRFPVLMTMKGERGQIDLLPPEPSDIHRIITGPALLAGVGFEKSAGGESLDQRILNDAVGHPEALPLLEFTLAQLYEVRTAEGLLTFAAYEKLGGVEGSIGRHAEAVFAAQPEPVRAAFGPVFQALVALDESDEARPVRRRVAMDTLAATPERRQLVEALLAARLLSSDRGEVFVAHEALLRRWERAVQWIEANRDRLRVRDRIAARMAEGAPLAESDPLTGLARHHLAEHSDTFDPAQRDYIASQLAQLAAAKRRRQRRLLLAFIAMCLVTITALIGITLMYHLWLEFNAKTYKAETINQQAESLVSHLLQTMAIDLNENRPFHPSNYIYAIDEYYSYIQREVGNDSRFRMSYNEFRWRHSGLIELGEMYVLVGDLESAERSFRQSVGIAKDWAGSSDQPYLFTDRLRPLNKLTGMFIRFGNSSNQRRLLELQLQPLDRLAVSHQRLGDFFDSTDQKISADREYRSAIMVREHIEKLIEGVTFQPRRLIWCDEQYGDWLLLNGRFQDALLVATKAVTLLDHDKACPARMNLAHAYLFNGQFDKAKAIHAKYLGTAFEDGRTWNDELRNDFKFLHEAGHDHPDMKKIEAMLGERESKP